MRTFSRFTLTDGNDISVDLSTVIMVYERVSHRIIFTPFNQIEVFETLDEIEHRLNDYRVFISNKLLN